MSYILKEIFGDTTRVKILEELTERWGEYLSISEIARMSDVSKRTVYTHIYQLEEIGIVKSIPGKTSKFGLNIDDKRVLALAILEDEEYLRRMEISIKESEKEELNTPVNVVTMPEKSLFDNFSISIKDLISCDAYNITSR